jgi:HSP20 family protein
MDTLKKLGSHVQQRMAGARQSLAAGWRELLRLSSGALTHFDISAKGQTEAEVEQHFPRWSLLAAETWETARAVIIRMEMPGMKEADIKVSVQRNLLHIRGEKRSGGDHGDRLYGLTERAYGRFERTLSLSQSIDKERMEVSYQEGVLTVILPKTTVLPPLRQTP